MMTHNLTCPECGSPMTLRVTSKFKTKDGQPRKFYGCSRWPKCDATHSAHPNGEPMGVPADKETKEWRIKAHAAFDLWIEKEGMMKSDAYPLLAEYCFQVREVHIGEMDIAACRKVIYFFGDPE